MKKILLHTCCAPCATASIEKLLSSDNYKVSAFYYNPNISPQEEETKRFEELERYLEERYEESVGLIRGMYDFDAWSDLVEPVSSSGEGGFRCKVCYYLRLLETFRVAKKGGFDAASSTLSISPYKNRKWLNEIGMLLSKKFSIEWIDEDYDYKRSVEISKEYDLYRQNYCGCSFSKAERYERLKNKKHTNKKSY